MTQYTTLNHNLKRGILRFSEKISKDLSKPLKKWGNLKNKQLLTKSLRKFIITQENSGIL